MDLAILLRHSQCGWAHLVACASQNGALRRSRHYSAIGKSSGLINFMAIFAVGTNFLTVT